MKTTGDCMEKDYILDIWSGDRWSIDGDYYSGPITASTTGPITVSTNSNSGYDYNPYNPIKGNMLTVQQTFSEFDSLISDPATKRILVEKLVDELMKSNYIYFTKQHDPRTGNVISRARIFVTPNDQTQLLKDSGVS